MAQQLVILDSAGNPVGVTTCQGRTCFPALQEGQSLGGPVAPETTSPTTIIDAAGVRINPATPTPLPPAMPGAAPAPSPSGAPPGPAPALPSQTREHAMHGVPDGVPIRPNQHAAVVPQPPAGVASRVPGGGYAGGVDPFTSIPNYQDGSRHPAAGGAPRIPGGSFAQQDGGYDNRVQVTNPETGASAGPFGVTAPRSPDSGSYGAGGSSGGGGGGIARDLYWKIRNQVEGNLTGEGAATSGAYPSDAQYRRQGRRMDRASDRYWDEVNDPDPQRATGWARRNLGKNRGDYPLMLSDPIRVATEGMGLDPNEQSGTFDFFASLPAADLAMIAGGTRNRGMTRKVDPASVPNILKGQIDPAKPEFKRELDYSKYARQLRDLYRGLGATGSSNVLDFDSLMGDLARAKKGGALRQGIDMQAQYDPGGALDRARGYFDSVFAAAKPEFQQGVYADMADRAFANQRLLGKKPKAISRTVKRVARQFV